MNGDVVEVVGSALVAGGDCLVRRNGEPVIFVPGLLPGERALVRIEQSRRDFAHASVVSILDANADRVAPTCGRVGDGCGGCDWQHLAPEAQHRSKRLIVVDALRRGAGLQDAEALVSIGASVDALAYRATVRAAVDASGRAGFRRLRSHGVVVSGACPVADRRIADVLEHGRFPGVDEILLRVSERTGEVVVSPGMTGIGITVPVGVRVGDENDQMSETVAGVELRVSMGSFFQSSAEAANLLVEAVAAALGVPAAPSGLHPVRSGLLVDLYGGIGLFAATLGRAYGRVVVVEHAARAASDARVNVATHARAEVVVTDVDEWRPTPTIHGELSGHGPGQIDVVADPARRGLGRGGVATIAALRPQVVVLVSCDAAALGRDARLLAGEGWALEHTTVLDLFPHTHHLEAVSRFVAR